MASPLKKTPPQLRCDASTALVPLRISANLTTLHPAALAAFVSASIERAEELQGHVPENRRAEYEAALRDARAELAAANKITVGAAAIASHEAIIAAGGHFSGALAALTTAGNVVRQSLEICDNPFIACLPSRIQQIAARNSKGDTRHGHR